MGLDIARDVAKHSKGKKKASKPKGKRGASKLKQRFQNGRVQSQFVTTIVPNSRILVHRIIEPDEFGKIEIDSRYQRGLIVSQVLQLMAVLSHGGIIPDPVLLADRKFKDEKTEAGKLYTIDGQQRFMAHLEQGVPMQAMIMETDSLAQERDLFTVRNARVNVSANYTVYAWSGVTAELIREAAYDEKSSLYNRIHFGFPGQGGNLVYPAAILARGLVAASSGFRAAGSIKKALPRGDSAVTKDDSAAERANKFLRLVPLVFKGQGTMRSLPCLALGMVSFKRWRERSSMPSMAVCGRLGAINFEKLAPTPNAQFVPLIESEMLRRWK